LVLVGVSVLLGGGLPPHATFWIGTLSVLWWLGSLAWFLRIFPRSPLVWLALPPAMVTLGALWIDSVAWTVAALALDLVAALLAAADLATLPARRSFSIERQTGRIASLKQEHRVTLTVSNHAPQPRLAWLRDGVPPELHPHPDEFTVPLAPRSRSTLHYDLRSTRRGAFTLRRAHLRVQSRYGLWQRLLDYPVTSLINIYPDMKQMAEYALLARTNRLSLMGVRRTRRIGQDNEFERLRDYTLDDNYKHIEWRSTARRGKLTVKDFQANQSQRVMFLVDCGRMMTNQAAGLSLLDHALNSMLMLSYVALQRGDSVGLVCFSDQIHTFVPPRGGRQQMNRLLHASFDRFPRLVESRYDEAFLYLGKQCRKRSLVVLVTNVIDEVNAHQVEQYLASMRGRHLPLGVLLRDRQLFEAADVEQPKGDELYHAAAAAEILSWRHQVLADLASRGVLTVDTFPEELTAPLINRYLEIKARHLL
jgi:uncharacterized protein (DUF58 family)